MLIITKENNSIKVVGQNNPTYPYSGTLVYPLNSVTVVTDQSDMAVFRSALNNDVLFTGLIENITIAGSPVTKEDIGTKFGAIANSSGSGGGGTGGAVDSVNGQTGTVVLTAADVNAYSKAETDEKLRDYTPLEAYATEIASIKTNMGNKADKSSLDNYLLKTDAQSTYETISGAQGKYQAKLTAGTGIEITGENVINVTLDTNIYQVVESLPDSDINPNKIYLVLNSESGESDLYIEYLYVNNKWEKIGEYKADVDLTPYLTKADAANTYQPKGEYLTSIPEEYVTETELEGKGYALNTSLEAEVTERQKQDSALGGMIAGETQAREQAINNLTATVQGKLDTATYNSEKAGFETKEHAEATYQPKGSYLTSVPDEYVTDTELNEKGYATEAWVTEQGYLTEHQDISGLATKEELNGKQNTLVSGTNIKTINSQSLLGSGNITIEGGGSGIATWDYAQIQSDQEYRTNFLSNVKVSDDLTNLGGSDNPDHASILTIDNNVYTVMYNVGGNPKVVSINIQESVASITTIDAIPKNYATTEQLNGKQDTLVSGTNIKTINGETILGEGNIQIETTGGGIPDAPSDDKTYGRKNGAWSEITQPDLSNYALKSEVPKQYVQEIGFVAPSSINIFDQDGNYKMIGFSDGITLGENGENVKVKLDDSFVNKVNAKQDTLVSGTNIKTVNGNSLLGSGDITIEGGGTSYTAGEGIDISEANVISVDKETLNIPTLQTNENGSTNNYVYSTGNTNSKKTNVIADIFFANDNSLDTLRCYVRYWGNDYTYNNFIAIPKAESNRAGAMSSLDKSKLDTLKSEWFGTQSQFDGIESKDDNTLYFITEE